MLDHTLNKLGEPVLTGLFSEKDQPVSDYVIIDGHVFERLSLLSNETHEDNCIQVDADVVNQLDQFLSKEAKGKFVSRQDAMRTILREAIQSGKL